MATDSRDTGLGFIAALEDGDWGRVAAAVSEAGMWLADSALEDERRASVVAAIVGAAKHRKWEVRQAAAHAIERLPSSDLDEALDTLIGDSHARVRTAAERARSRRAALGRSSELGREHDARVVASLEQIELSHGKVARQAAKRVGQEIAETFTRELYHEMAKLMAPLLTAVDRVRSSVSHSVVATSVVSDLSKIEAQVRHVRAVLDAMKSYAAVPRLTPRPYRVEDLAKQACIYAQSSTGAEVRVTTAIPDGLEVVVDRTRMVQALANIIANAIEAAAEEGASDPVALSAKEANGYIVMEIVDHGPGMSEQRIREARELFGSRKPHGTGFGVPLAVKVIESEHHGRLRFESTPGRGTRVVITIPEKAR